MVTLLERFLPGHLSSDLGGVTRIPLVLLIRCLEWVDVVSNVQSLRQMATEMVYFAWGGGPYKMCFFNDILLSKAKSRRRRN